MAINLHEQMRSKFEEGLLQYSLHRDVLSLARLDHRHRLYVLSPLVCLGEHSLIWLDEQIDIFFCFHLQFLLIWNTRLQFVMHLLDALIDMFEVFSKPAEKLVAISFELFS